MIITIAQLNPIIGDIKGNLNKIVDTLTRCQNDSPDLVIFPELFIVGYPPRDLLDRKWFIQNTQHAIQELIRISADYPNTGILVGVPQLTKKKAGRGLYNSALLIYRGEILFSQPKSLLPTYDVFDEARYFDVATKVKVVTFKDNILGISICEDAWNDPELWPKRFYPFDPQEILAKKGATVFINISASPFHLGKEKVRFRIFQNHAKKHHVPFIFVNQVGGNDELIFDGRSMFIDQNGNLAEIMPSFKEHIQTIDLKHIGSAGFYHAQNEIESIYEALVLGLRDYIIKCGFSKVVIGLSGGIDSAVVCCLAKEAIGRENVLGVTMPGPYSSKGSIEDSKTLANNLGIRFNNIQISSVYESYVESLNDYLDEEKKVDVTLENIQARIRGNILMALSNKYGYLVLSTGNKSELAIGYCTLYGDMTGGLAVISDVHKTIVYKLAHYINRKAEVIPRVIIKKPPSAELKPNQKDQDSLPPYEILDPILRYYLDEGYSPKEILDLNFEPNIVKWVIKAVDRNEYKRRQAAPGLKVTPKAFGVGRRMPIAARYET
ncbi:MAG: NAD+ synthase [Thermoplasmatales archaeon]|nr:MAG: NAD+ synthase [Thermoplasmatales archaeon]